MKIVPSLFLGTTLLFLPACTYFDTSVTQQPFQTKNTINTSAYNVLCMGDKLIRNGVIVKGSCWDYIDYTFTKAGVPQHKRLTVFKSKKRGPYVNSKKIKAGDWLYFLNRSYHNSEHSGIFIRWVDKSKKMATLLSYQGEGKRKPARYKNYILTHVYNIMRTNDKKCE